MDVDKQYNYHQNTASSIVDNQVQSIWLPDNQGFRQGGELTSFLYLVFISDRLNEPEMCSKKTGVLIKCSK